MILFSLKEDYYIKSDYFLKLLCYTKFQFNLEEKSELNKPLKWKNTISRNLNI